jgi:hypothetical protein
MLTGVDENVCLSSSAQATIMADVFEDNQGCIALATDHRLTSHKKHFHVKSYWFWYNYKVHKEFEISYIQSLLQVADYLTKYLPKDIFRANRQWNQGW